MISNQDIFLILMLILAIIFGTIAYFVYLFKLPSKTYKRAIQNGKSKKHAFLLSFLVFNAIYLPVFWDLIPHFIAYSYYCQHEAGFVQNKTIEQWKAENPKDWETLKAYTYDERNKNSKEIVVEGYVYESEPINSRLSSLYRSEDMGLSIVKISKLLYDEEKKEIVVKFTRICTTENSKLLIYGKFWLNNDPCSTGYLERSKDDANYSKFSKLKDQFSNNSL